MKSKIRQEEELRKWVSDMQAKYDDDFTEVVTLCPFFTLGPMLTKYSSSSIEGLRKIISGEVPGIPQL